MIVAGITLSTCGVAAPPPAPVGFLWVDQGLTQNADNGTFNLPELAGFALFDSTLTNGPGVNADTIDSGRANIAVPGATGSGSAAGDRFYQIETNSISLDFAISGNTSAFGFGIPTPTFTVTGNLDGDFGAGQFSIGSFNQSFTGSFDSPLSAAPTASGVGLTDGSPISLDLAGDLEIVGTDGGGGLAFGFANASLTFNGDVTLDQSYRTYELVASLGSPIPEPSTGLLVLLGMASLFKRRRVCQ